MSFNDPYANPFDDGVPQGAYTPTTITTPTVGSDLTYQQTFDDDHTYDDSSQYTTTATGTTTGTTTTFNNTSSVYNYNNDFGSALDHPNSSYVNSDQYYYNDVQNHHQQEHLQQEDHVNDQHQQQQQYDHVQDEPIISKREEVKKHVGKPSPYLTIEVKEPEQITESKFGAHTVYKVVATLIQGNRTLVQRRRYNDFEWLYRELTQKYPGYIVPALPEKKAIGRFDTDFIENRRYFLEKFLRRIANHHVLVHSDEFMIFFQSDSVDTKKESKGFFQVFGDVFADVSFTKTPDEDKWFEERKNEILVLETQLRHLHRRVELICRQRKELGTAITSFWNGVSSIKYEGDGSVFSSLAQLGEVQKKVEEVHQKESDQYVTNFGNTVEEYIRTIGSIKIALSVRSNYAKSYKMSLDKLEKKKERLDKIMGQMDKADVVSTAVQEVDECQRQADETRKDFDKISEILNEELKRFDEQMKVDFEESMRSFVTNMIEGQHEIMKWWESYLPQIQSLSPN